jgi:hypothetical protein
MYVLSFRDLAAPRSGAVTSAVMLELRGVDPAWAWNNPLSLRNRIGQGQAGVLSWAEVSAALRDKRVCFLVHGFNVNRDHGYTGEGALAQELLGLGPVFAGQPPAAMVDLVIPVLWPGDWILPGVNYPFELGDVRATGERFAEFLRSEAQTASRVSFVSHSLGARVVLETVARAVAAGKPASELDLAILTAAAADDDVLDDPRYRMAIGALRQILVVSSMDDDVLGRVFPLGDAVEAALWQGEKASSRALGRFGPKALKPGSAAAGKVRWFDIDPAEKVGHDHYFPEPWMKTPLANGYDPRRQRLSEFLRAAFGAGPLHPHWPIDRPLPT